MKTTEKILKELLLTLILFLSLACLISSIITCREETVRQGSKEDTAQMQEMKDFHHSQGRKIQVY